MKNTIIKFIMFIIETLFIVAFVMFGMIVYDEFISENENFAIKTSGETEVEDFVTTSSNRDTISENRETPAVMQGSWDDLNLGETNIEQVDYSNVQVDTDRYFYNQLEETSKTIYKALEQNKEKMKSGTYKVEFGNSFSNVLNAQGGSDKLGDYYQSAIEAFIYDNAELFYLSPNKMYLKITQYSNNKYDVWIDNDTQANYLVDEFSSKAQVDSCIAQMESVRNNILSRRTGNTIDDIKMIHDYLVDNISYDTTLSKQNIYDAYGALVRGEAVCEGYARAFKYLMNEIGVPCVLVMGNGTNSQGQTENHAWNYIQINGKWYAVDTTWDDPVIVGGGTLSREMKYKYYLKGSNSMSSNHRPNGQFTPNGKVFKYPELSSSDY